MSGVRPGDLTEANLLRELKHLHDTRHEAFLHGAPDALREHSRRTAQLEEEYLRRHPERDVDPARTRSGARDAYARGVEARVAYARESYARGAEARDAEARDAEARDAEARGMRAQELPGEDTAR
jgi:hypothetical protein